MAKAGGKGRISNGLVAASCAAVMAVYAAGYWRTREEAHAERTLDGHEQFTAMIRNFRFIKPKPM